MKEGLNNRESISVLAELVSDFADLLLVEGFSDVVVLFDSLFVPFVSSLSSFVLEILDKVLLTPSDLVGEISELAELSKAGKLDASEGIRNDFSLLGIIGGGNSLENLESGHSGGTLGGFVWDHTSDGSPEHSGGSSVMNECSSGVS
jgi:hypothetical protein